MSRHKKSLFADWLKRLGHLRSRGGGLRPRRMPLQSCPNTTATRTRPRQAVHANNLSLDAVFFDAQIEYGPREVYDVEWRSREPRCASPAWNGNPHLMRQLSSDVVKAQRRQEADDCVGPTTRRPRGHDAPYAVAPWSGGIARGQPSPKRRPVSAESACSCGPPGWPRRALEGRTAPWRDAEHDSPPLLSAAS